MLIQNSGNSEYKNYTHRTETPLTSKALYEQLLADPQSDRTQKASRRFLQESLAAAVNGDCGLPEDISGIESWITTKTLGVGQQYAQYLQHRKAGNPREFFSSKAHALYFLRAVSPTKLVDGSWLYGTLEQWQDPDFHPLIRTYLEELGDGVAQMNHVLMYRRLLARYGCEAAISLPDDYYIQGAVQLALGHHCRDFLPEVIGYNLGYEQLPLHLLICAFELNELNIDPYYFTLHITIDNAHNGHAHQAARAAIRQCLRSADPRFYQRIRAGYQLNDLGVGSMEVIRSFNLERELVRMLEAKRAFGSHVHSDYCKLDGKTVNQWLSSPGQMLTFLRVLEERGWIKRGADPIQSRFWNLISGANAMMFGVFSEYEQRLIYEWIADDWLWDPAVSTGSEASFRHGFRTSTGSRQSKYSRAGKQAEADLDLEVWSDQKILSPLLAELGGMDLAQQMARLISLMSPARHCSPEGLSATRKFFAQLFKAGC